MIINVGARSDIVNYYSKWLLNRLNEGYAYSRNPLFKNNVSKLSLKLGFLQNIKGTLNYTILNGNTVGNFKYFQC